MMSIIDKIGCKEPRSYGKIVGIDKDKIETHNTNEFKQRMIDSIGKKVMCLNTGEVFDCVRQAAAWCGLSKKGDGDIGRCCKGKRKTAGKHPITGERLRWKFV